jgi:hypothetical protein
MRAKRRALRRVSSLADVRHPLWRKCPLSVRHSIVSGNSSQTGGKRTLCRCPPNGRLTDKQNGHQKEGRIAGGFHV